MSLVVQDFIMDDLCMVRLDVSIWSGRARLRREDLPSSVELPPEDVATLGSKRLFDPAKLKIFNTLKARAAGVLDKKCVRFMGGWATHYSVLPQLADELESIADEFNRARHDFMIQYDEGVADWIAQFPQWENILQAAIPCRSELKGKFSFAWQMVKVSPAPLPDTNKSGNNFDALVEQVPERVLDEIISGLTEAYNECFADKETVTRKAFRPIKTQLAKLDALSWTHPVLQGYHRLLSEALGQVEQYSTSEMHVRMFKYFLQGMTSKAMAITICEDFMENMHTRSTDAALVLALDPFWNASNTGGMSSEDKTYFALKEAEALLESLESGAVKQEAEKTEETYIPFENVGLW